jgi:glycine/D-amino acid oxidase-like deaminating enzyme
MSTATVVGAGVSGAAIARALTLRGWDVTVVEQYAPGTVRSASGGDTRLLRMSHGGVEWYTRSAWAARSAWIELQERTGTRIWEPVGLAWFAHSEDGFERQSRELLESLQIPVEWVSPDDARGLFPSLRTDDLAGVLFEPAAGVLHARRATQLLVDEALASGARLEPGRVEPAAAPHSDVVIWACGAWLPGLFPRDVEVRISRRDVFFFGADASWRGTPGFCDYDGGFYGHGELAGLGVKVASDADGAEIDPDTLERLPDAERERAARSYAAHRFPGLAGAPVIGSRVCQYDLTTDTHLIVDRHPEHDNWWLIGGGSGHSFKHGPAFGEYVADCIEGRRDREPFHALGERTGDAGLRTRGHL